MDIGKSPSAQAEARVGQIWITPGWVPKKCPDATFQMEPSQPVSTHDELQPWDQVNLDGSLWIRFPPDEAHNQFAKVSSSRNGRMEPLFWHDNRALRSDLLKKVERKFEKSIEHGEGMEIRADTLLHFKFADLWDGPDEKILAYAKCYGPLGCGNLSSKPETRFDTEGRLRFHRRTNWTEEPVNVLRAESANVCRLMAIIELARFRCRRSDEKRLEFTKLKQVIVSTSEFLTERSGERLPARHTWQSATAHFTENWIDEMGFSEFLTGEGQANMRSLLTDTVDDIMRALSDHVRAHISWTGSSMRAAIDIRAVTGLGAVYASAILGAYASRGDQRFCQMCGRAILAPEDVEIRSSRKYCYGGSCSKKAWRRGLTKKVPGRGPGKKGEPKTD